MKLSSYLIRSHEKTSDDLSAGVDEELPCLLLSEEQLTRQANAMDLADILHVAAALHSICPNVPGNENQQLYNNRWHRSSIHKHQSLY